LRRAAAAGLILICGGGWLATAVRAAPLSAFRNLIDSVQMHHPNALWHIVHSLCVTDMKASGDPAPCAQVDQQGGYAVLKDIQRRSQFLVLPTRRIPGIESPDLLAPGAPNYWQDAWAQRWRVAEAVGRPATREEVGLAVNSVLGRTQNQLHIHIDCVRPDVLKALHGHEAELGSHWRTLSFPVVWRRFKARWVRGEDLGANDPFKLLAADPVARADMAGETLAVIAAQRAKDGPGFILLADRVDPATDDIGVAEELLDHHCRVLAAGASPG